MTVGDECIVRLVWLLDSAKDRKKKTLRGRNACESFFKRWVRKRPDMHKDIAEALGLLVVNPFIPQLETHKLKEKLSGSWACSAGKGLSNQCE